MQRFFFFLFFCAAFALGAENLIRDPEFDSARWQDEVRSVESVQQLAVTRFVEPYTWNHCVRMELKSFGFDKDGKRCVRAGVLLGGDAKKPGFVCRPDTVYKFTVEVRGDAPRAMINFYEWGTTRSKARTDIHLIRPQKDWTVYRGTFKTGPTAERAALMIQFWGNEASKQLEERLGQYILIDKVSIEENAPSLGQGGNAAAAVKPAAELPVYVVSRGEWDTAVVIPEFRDFTVDCPAKLSHTTAKLRYDDKNLYVRIDAQQPHGTVVAAPRRIDGENAIWQDDLCELFFSAQPDSGRYRQFVITAGGARWCGDGTPVPPADAMEWTAKTRVAPDAWHLEAAIPFASLGLKGVPESGTIFRFNLCRQRPLPGVFDEPDFKLGNRWGGQRMFDMSNYAFANGDFAREKAKWAVLVFDTLQPHADRVRAAVKDELNDPAMAKINASIDLKNPVAAFAALETLKKQARLVKLGKEKFLLNQISPSSNPALPFMPRELGAEQPVFKIRAAVNEYAPLALGNMTGEYEEYRVFVNSGWARQEASQEHSSTVTGLRGMDGGSFPASKITLRRGVAVKDSDAPVRVRRLDPLVELGAAGIMPVPPRQAGLLWAEFDCRNAKPGIYRGRITVIPLSERTVSFKHEPKVTYNIVGGAKHFPVELEILPITLPVKSPMPFNAYARAMRDDQPEFMGKYDCNMFMVTPWYFTFKYRTDGTISEYSVRSFLVPQIRRVAEYLRRHPEVADPKVMLGYSVYPVWKQHLIPKFLKFGTPEYWNAWRNFCLGFDRILQENGIARADYAAEIFDEPNIKDFPAAELNRAHSEYKAALPGARVLMTSGISYFADFYSELAKNIDIWIFSFYHTHLPDYRKKMEHFQSLSGKKSSIYACGTSMRQELYRYYRLLPWNALEARCDGVSLFQMFSQIPLSGDMHKVPAGEVAWMLSETILSSLRLENLRIGLTDVKYLKLLEQLAAGKNTPAARAARKFLADAAREVYVVYPHETTHADAVRAAAIGHILKLSQP